jgi:hypothetical protein
MTVFINSPVHLGEKGHVTVSSEDKWPLVDSKRTGIAGKYQQKDDSASLPMQYGKLSGSADQLTVNFARVAPDCVVVDVDRVIGSASPTLDLRNSDTSSAPSTIANALTYNHDSRATTVGHQPKATFWLLPVVALAAVLGASAWVIHHFRMLTLEPVAGTVTPIPVWEGNRLRLMSPTGHLLAEAGTYHDELTAYLYFEYLRSLRAVDSANVLLTAGEDQSGPTYRVYLQVDGDLLHAVPYLAELQARRFVSSFELSYANPYRVTYARAQTRVFVAAYDQPVRRKLRGLPRSKLASNVARFILFKSKTDRRIRQQIEPLPPDLSQAEARDLAADILAIADFYDLPLDFFLGIGAMENNYMDVRGDLEHTTWKQCAQPGDLVVRRRGTRVLVRNYSIGIWQITRETLRYAHALFLQDTRAYAKLPARLRPPEHLDLQKIDSHVLTTYAGLLFRDLLDRFDGNVGQAVGAYNGGTKNPNARYATGVELVADYARRVLTQAAYLNGRALAQTRFIFATQGRAPNRP